MYAEAAEIIDKLHRAGYEAYFVGGCVRDQIMQRAYSDVDITTNALPAEIKQVFSDHRTLDFGMKHGTVTVLFGEHSYEITTYRFDCGYVDHRHPAEVKFGVSLYEDLERRDFTINAVAWDGVLDPVDPFGGVKDIRQGIIRAVGEPICRFREDALRILRGLRFAATFGFDIEEKTANAMRSERELLRFVSAERIWQELSKLLLGIKAGEIILRYSEVLEVVLPELSDMRGFEQKNPHHIYDVLNHTAVALDAAETDLTLRTAVLFHDCGKPSTFSLDENGIGHFYGHAARSVELARFRLEALRVDNATKDRVLRLIEHHDSPPEENTKQVIRRMRKLGEDYMLLVALREADNQGQAPEFHRKKLHTRCRALYQEVIEAHGTSSDWRLQINGNDLLACGAIPGKNIGMLLSSLSEDVLEGRTENQRTDLLLYAKRNYPQGFGETNE